MMDLGFWATEQNMEWSGWTIFGGVGSRIYIVKSAFLIFLGVPFDFLHEITL